MTFTLGHERALPRDGDPHRAPPDHRWRPLGYEQAPPQGDAGRRSSRDHEDWRMEKYQGERRLQNKEGAIDLLVSLKFLQVLIVK